MPYATAELLAEAGRSLRGAHNFAVVTFPALLREARREGQPPTQLVTFGSTLERQIYDESFSLGEPPKPYLSVWGEPPGWVGSDNARKGLQAQRTRDAFARDVFIDDADSGRRTQFALKPEAGRAMLTKCDPVRIVDLAVWLARGTEFAGPDEVVAWFREQFPADGTDLFGTLYLPDVPASYRAPRMWADAPANPEQILAAFGAPPMPAAAEVDDPGGAGAVGMAVAQDPLESAVVDDLDSLEFSRATAEVSLRASTIDDTCAFVERRLSERHIIFPDQSALVRRCVVALLTGHLILQGPPGTGKTTLARILAEAFECLLEEVTATSEWTPFNVVGGYRMSSGSGGLRPHYGHLTWAVMRCAEVVHADQESSGTYGDDETEPTLDLGDAAQSPQAVWLLIDEFNRADIDKAIGSLYTLLGSTHPDNLARSPLDLWFEEDPARRYLWVPGRFRIIGSMNDLDTAFVNRISQGLTRRFQFITVGVPHDAPTDASPVTSEVGVALAQARNWVLRVYGATWTVPAEAALRNLLEADLVRLSALVATLREPGAVPGWPVGTAQVVDVLRTLVLEAVAGDTAGALDRAVADRLVPQMGTIDDEQFEQFGRALEKQSLTLAAAELRHLIDPHLA